MNQEPAQNSLGNPVEYADIAVRNVPSAEAPAPPQPAPAPLPAAQAVETTDEKLEKDLKEVNQEVKASAKKPEKSGKPILIIIISAAVAIGLAAAAYIAFSKS